MYIPTYLPTFARIITDTEGVVLLSILGHQSLVVVDLCMMMIGAAYLSLTSSPGLLAQVSL